MRSVIFASGELIAAGWICPKPDAGRQAAIWTSTDGRTWAPPAVLLSPTIDDEKPEAQVNGVESLGSSRLVAVGTVKIESGALIQGKRRRVDWDAAVWTSEDGSRWTPTPVENIAEANASGFGDQYMSGITEWRGALIAVGGWGFLQHTHASVWMSRDGKVWEQMSERVGQVIDPLFSRSINAVTAVGPLIVAVGYTELLSEKWPQIWHSTDGHHWISPTDKLGIPRAPHGEALAVQPIPGTAASSVGWQEQHGTQTKGAWQERFDQTTSTAPA